MITILFFANVRDEVGFAKTTYTLENSAIDSKNITALKLLENINVAQKVINIPNLRCAINQTMANLQDIVRDGDEVAFFPPVTGG